MLVPEANFVLVMTTDQLNLCLFMPYIILHQCLACGQHLATAWYAKIKCAAQHPLAQRPSTTYHKDTLSCDFTCAEVCRLIKQGDSPNEVEGAGNVPLHAAAYQGWVEGIILLLQLGAKVKNVIAFHLCAASVGCCEKVLI